jgi:hypothetical protein
VKLFVQSRRLYLELVVSIAIVKLVLSAVVPPSFELRDIFSMATGAMAGGPWSFLEAFMIQIWLAVTHANVVPANWWALPPLSMPFDVRLLLLLLRLPVIASDIAILTVLHYTVSLSWSAERARLVGLLWFLNPFAFLAGGLLAVPDVVVVLCTLVAFLLILRGRVVFSSLALGLGVALKLYPILLVPAFLVFTESKPRHARIVTASMIVLPLLGLGGYLGWVMPQGFSAAALLNYDPISQPITGLVSNIPGSLVSFESIVLMILYYVTFTFAKGKRIALNNLILPIFLIAYTFSDPYAQYFVWAMPFLALDAGVGDRRRRIEFVTLLLFLLGVWFLVSGGFLTPSGYSFLLFPLEGQNLPGYAVAIGSFLSGQFGGYVLLLLLQAGLHGMTLIYSLEVFRGWFNAG